MIDLQNIYSKRFDLIPIIIAEGYRVDASKRYDISHWKVKKLGYRQIFFIIFILMLEALFLIAQ